MIGDDFVSVHIRQTLQINSATKPEPSMYTHCFPC